MTNPIKNIYRFNQEAGLLDKGYDDERECAYPIEEMLEGFCLSSLDCQLNGDFSKEDLTGKAMSRSIMRYVSDFQGTDVDRFDKHLDAIVFNFGSLFKLGLTPQQVMKGLSVVMQANMQKLHAGQDSEGKQLKPDDWDKYTPESLLQKILDERRKNDV